METASPLPQDTVPLLGFWSRLKMFFCPCSVVASDGATKRLIQVDTLSVEADMGEDLDSREEDEEEDVTMESS
jgi:hypothetical protein